MAQARVTVGSTSADPEQTEAEREALRQAADLLAKVLDTAIPIPGTSLRIGLDPLLGVVPGIGDAIAGLIGSSILVIGARVGIPRITLFRMSLNMFLNGTLGAIPVLGDVFSVWFRSNARNAALLRKHSRTERRTSTAGDWLFVVSLGLATITAMIAVIVGLLWATARLWNLVSG